MLLAALAALASEVRAQTVVEAFDPNTNGTVRALAVQADGRVLLGGHFTTVQGQNRNYLARVGPTGTLDLSFNPNPTGPVYAIVAQPDGKIVIGGAFTVGPRDAYGYCSNYDGCYQNLARLNADGTVDHTFRWDFQPAPVSGLALQPDGKILIISSEWGVLVRYTTDGVFDDGAWAPPYDKWIPSPRSVAVQPDGGILIGGVSGIVRVYADGTPDLTFGTTWVDRRGNPCSAPYTGCTKLR
jgi:uncharacterized delta-60 repeat protein